MKNILQIVLSILAIFALMYFSNPPKLIHYLLAFPCAVNAIRIGYSMAKKKA